MRPRHRQPPPRLVRRAIPPRRGRIRKRYVLLISLLLFVGWLSWVVVRAINARPGPFVDYAQQLLDRAAASQPPGPNGWPILVEALSQYRALGWPSVEDWPTEPDALYHFQGLDRVLEGEFDAERFRLELLYAEHLRTSGVLELLDEVAAHRRIAREGFVTDGGEGLLMVLLPELAQVRQMARARMGAMRFAAVQGDMNDLVRAWRHILSLSRAMSHDTFLICHLVGIAVMTQGCDELDRLLTEFDLDETTCRRLVEVMNERPILAPMAEVFERERLAQYDTIQRVYTDDGRGDGLLIVSRLSAMGAAGRLGPVALGEHPMFNVAGLVFPSRRETTEALDVYFNAAVEQSGMARAQRERHLVDLEAYPDSLPRLQYYLRLILPSLHYAQGSDDFARTRLAATRLLLAIESHQARHGRLPSTLDDLVSEFLEALPTDVISGGPFIYLVRAPDEDDSRPYWLYSAGLDGVDNGGVEPTPPIGRLKDPMRGGDESAGFDFILNRLREPVSEDR